MFPRRRGRPPPSEDLRRAFARFEEALTDVEAAKATLVSVVPAGRVQGTPLAQAIDGFELGLEAAARAMPSWRTPEVEEVWAACEAALGAASAAAAALRSADAPEGYEALLGALEGLLDPLEAFEDALRRFARLGLPGR